MFNNDFQQPTTRSERILSSKKTEYVLISLIFLTFFASLFLGTRVEEQRAEQNNTADAIVDETDSFAQEEANRNLESYETRKISVENITYNVIISDSDEKRILGLSNSTQLPDGIDGMLFIFDEFDFHSIWMKDMNYDIDIMWLDENFQIVYWLVDISPDTYPSQSFSSPVPALYVLEIPSQT